MEIAQAHHADPACSWLESRVAATRRPHAARKQPAHRNHAHAQELDTQRTGWAVTRQQRRQQDHRHTLRNMHAAQPDTPKPYAGRPQGSTTSLVTYKPPKKPACRALAATCRPRHSLHPQNHTLRFISWTRPPPHTHVTYTTKPQATGQAVCNTLRPTTGSEAGRNVTACRKTGGQDC
jgi:hypothetical protein